MPFEEERPPFIYTGIINGKFVVRAKDDDKSDKIITRKNAEDKEVREYHYRSLKNVYLADIKVDKHEKYGKSWEFYLIDGNQYICWKQSVKGAIGSKFLKMVEGIDLTKPFNLVPGWDKVKETNQIFVSQGETTNEKGELVPIWLKSNYPYVEGQQSECPSGKVITVNDEEVWDFTDQNKFLWEKVVMSLKPFLPGVSSGMASAAQHQSGAPPEGDPQYESGLSDSDNNPTPPPPAAKQGVTYDPNADQGDDLPF